MVDGEMTCPASAIMGGHMTVINILNNPQKLAVRFQLVAERVRLAEERKAIRLKFTLAIIEEILKS